MPSLFPKPNDGLSLDSCTQARTQQREGISSLPLCDLLRSGVLSLGVLSAALAAMSRPRVEREMGQGHFQIMPPVPCLSFDDTRTEADEEEIAQTAIMVPGTLSSSRHQPTAFRNATRRSAGFRAAKPPTEPEPRAERLGAAEPPPEA